MITFTHHMKQLSDSLLRVNSNQLINSDFHLTFRSGKLIGSTMICGVLPIYLTKLI